MERTVYFVIFILIMLESSIYLNFPYYSISLSFLGYITYKKRYYSLIYSFFISLIVGVSGYHLEKVIIFFLIYNLILLFVYKHIHFDKINIIFVSLLEVILYYIYVYFFETNELFIQNWIRGYFFVLIYNYIFYRLEKTTSK